MQGYHLGRELRDRYTRATGVDAVPLSAVTTYSTDIDRTVDTAHALMLGLLSNDTESVLNEDLPGRCKCRQDHGVRSTVECVSECLQLGADAVPAGMPEVNVRFASTHCNACMRAGVSAAAA